MRLYSSFNFYASIYGAALIAVSNLHDVAARIVGSSDIRENIKESKSFAKRNKGEECVKLEADVFKTKEDIENVDVGVLGCGEALMCLEDASSSTGARCVDSVEVEDGWSGGVPSFSGKCKSLDQLCMLPWDKCCDGLKCKPISKRAKCVNP